jgi:hypothetical protein
LIDVSKKRLKIINEELIREIFAFRSLLFIYGETVDTKKEIKIPREIEWKS